MNYKQKNKKTKKQYAKKGLIHTGKDSIAPTDKQWKRIMNYHKDKVLKCRITPVRTIKGKRPDDIKI